MKLMLGLLAFSSCLVTIQCGFQTIVANPGGIGGIFKGPDSETIVKGPDGSVITSEQNGGLIQTEQKLEPIIVAEPEIVEAHPVLPPSLAEDGYIAPLVPVKNVVIADDANNVVPVVSSGISAPLPNYIGPPTIPVSSGHEINIIEPEPHIIQTEIIDAPAIESKESTDLVGPSGSISTRGSESIVSGPASTTITKTAKVLVAPPVITATAGVPHVITPVHVPTLIEVNNEIPVASAGSIITGTESSTVYPLKADGLLRPTITPPIVTGSPILYPLTTSVASTPIPKETVIQQVRPVPSQLPLLTQSSPVFPTGLLTGEQFDRRHQVSTTINPLHDQFTVPKVSPKVSVEDEGASGFIQPGSIYGIPSSTLTPILTSSQAFYGGTPSSTVSPTFSSTSPFYEGNPSTTVSPITSSDIQHVLNPYHIPSRNIIPPEIGIPRGPIDLGTTITSVTKNQEANKSPGIINLQGIDNDNIQRTEYTSDNDHTFQNGYYRTDVLLGTDPNSVYHQQRTATLNDPLLTETNPILYQNGIKQSTNNYYPGSLPSEPGINPNINFNDRPQGHAFNVYDRKRSN
ncbi:mucin-2-like [Diorhabda carinulata]|uniref:mucin-2-like n=1 Tax=Diorhabda carinulata TaxID=1163345 RepID=UPI0025A00E2B|nr:mucin-2-like [Diorhabda carinulata]